jgi:hypothetical protein
MLRPGRRARQGFDPLTILGWWLETTFSIQEEGKPAEELALFDRKQ